MQPRAGRALQLLLIAGTLGVAMPARGQCADGSSLKVGLTAGIGVGAGAAGALATAGLLEGLDDSRDFSFGIGLGVGIGVSAGLAGLYALVDGSTGCSMANETATIVWSVPIVTFIVGAALPLAVWGASDEVGMPDDEPPPESAAAGWHRSPGGLPPLMLRHSWQF